MISSRSIDHSPSGGQIRGRVISFFNPDPINNRPTGHKVSIYRVDGIEAHPSQRSFKTIFFFPLVMSVPQDDEIFHLEIRDQVISVSNGPIK